MKKAFIVQIDVPSGVFVQDVREYIEQAVISHCGGLNPSDPLFELDRSSVEVITASTPFKRREQRNRIAESIFANAAAMPVKGPIQVLAKLCIQAADALIMELDRE